MAAVEARYWIAGWSTMGTGSAKAAGTPMQRWWPTLAALALLVAVAAVVIGVQVHRVGRFVYALDDAYIDLALAKNLVGHHVWGVTAYEFSSAASSILWPILLAGVFLITGPTDLAPAGLTLLAGALCVVVGGAVLRRCGVRGWREFVILALVVLLAPIVPVALTGLEHTGHALASICLSYLGAVVLARRERGGALGRGLMLCLMAALTVTLRYEGLFLTAAIVGLLILQRRITLATVLIAAAWAPVVGYGIFSTSHQGMWLPNPVAIKGHLGSMHSTAETLHAFKEKLLNVRYMAKAANLVLLAALAAVLYLRRFHQERRAPTVPGFMALTYVIAVGLHLLLAELGYFFRYELYLVVLGLVVVGANLWTDGAPEGDTAEAGPTRGARVFTLAVPALSLLACAGLAARAAVAHWNAPGASTDIYNLDHQLADFVRKYYNDSCVVINDIGVVSYQTDARVFDVWGLANTDAAQVYMNGKMNSGTIGPLAEQHGATMAAVYDHLLGPDRPPAGWRKVASWTVRSHSLDLYPLNFYATRESGAGALREHMREFAKTMTPEVDIHEEPVQ